MISKEKLECIKLFEEGLFLYREKKFTEAMLKFNEALKKDPNDSPTKLFIERCNHFIKNPVPENWDGVYDMTTK